jgi:hypothetical protein
MQSGADATADNGEILVELRDILINLVSLTYAAAADRVEQQGADKNQFTDTALNDCDGVTEGSDVIPLRPRAARAMFGTS